MRRPGGRGPAAGSPGRTRPGRAHRGRPGAGFPVTAAAPAMAGEGAGGWRGDVTLAERFTADHDAGVAGRGSRG